MAMSTLTIKDGNNASQSMAQSADPAGTYRPMVDLDNRGVAAYRASANFTPQATAAVTMITVKGSATKTVRIKKLGISGVSTAVSQSILKLTRTTALGAGGTEVNPTVGKLDSGSAAATAVVAHWTTTAKALGTTSEGPLSMQNIQTGVVTTPATLALGGVQWLFPENGVLAGQAIVLRGTAEFLEVSNVTPANLGAGTVYTYFVEWEEDAS